MIDQKISGLLANPLFMGGLGLLGSGGVNPVQHALLGIQSAQQTKDKRLNRDRLKKQDERQSVLDARKDQDYQRDADFRAQFGKAWESGDKETALSLLAQNKPTIAAQIMQGEKGHTRAIDLINLRNKHQEALQGDRQAHELSMADKRAALGSEMPAGVREYEYVKQLPEDEQKAYNAIKRGDPEPSAAFEKRLFDVNDKALDARRNSNQYANLAERLEKSDMSSGFAAGWSEWAKKVTGSEDGDTLLRKKAIQLRNNAAIQNLPPGVASDKDIEIVMSGFLSDNANPQTVAQYMRGLAKLESYMADYHEFEAEYLSEDPKRGPRGMNEAWRNRNAEPVADKGWKIIEVK